MTGQVRIEAVVEMPWFEGEPPWPWPIATIEPFTFARVWEGMSDREVGSVIGQLIKYNDLPVDGDAATVLSHLLMAGELSLPGGLRVVSGDEPVIVPGCCSGLEGWSEWLGFAEGKGTPWLGHDPAPWIEESEGRIRVWSDGGIGPAPGARSVDFDWTSFFSQLESARDDLVAFLGRLETWSAAAGFPHPPSLSRKLDEFFAIRRG